MKNIINRALAAEKKLFTLLLAVAASVGTMFASTKIGGLYYNLDATSQTAEVTSQNSSYPYWSTTITTANIPASVTYNSVTYSVTSIGGSAFADCRGLTSVTIPNSVTSIGDGAFYDCTGLTSVTIPNSVTSIGEWAFGECTVLTSVAIPNSVTSIGEYAFYECYGLTSVTIPNSVTSIGEGAFERCTGLTSPVYNAHVFAKMPTSYAGAYTIPDGIESIAGYAFYQCSSLTSVTIPNSVTSIGGGAFRGCTSLTSVTIPNIVTSIGNYAFSGCSGLTSVTIPNSVTSIGSYTFNGCSGLTSVTIPNSVTSIGDDAFWGCSGLTSVTIPNSVTSIGEWAFWYCTGLTSVTIPNSVTSIGSRAFAYCTGLTSVTNFANTPQEIDSDVFNNVDKSTCVLYVPAGSISAYKSANRWKDFSNILPIGAQPADVTTTTVTPSATTADIAWPQVTGAATYTIEIKKNGELICTLTFNAQGQLISIALTAPSRNNAPQQAQAAGFAFTVTSLDSGTTYSYTMTAKGNNGNVLKTESGTFTTTGDAQGIEEISSSLQGGDRGRLIYHNGQIYLLRGDKVYTLQGQEVR